MGILSIAFPFLQPRVSAPLLPLRPDTEHRRGSKRRRTRLHRCFPRCCTCLSPRRAARGQARRGRDTQGGSREPRIYLILLHSGIQGRVHSTCHTCTHRSRRSSWSSSGSIHGPFLMFRKAKICYPHQFVWYFSRTKYFCFQDFSPRPINLARGNWVCAHARRL